MTDHPTPPADRSTVIDWHSHIVRYVEDFIRRIHCDGDSEIHNEDIPALLDAIADAFESARNAQAASHNIVMLARRIARAKVPERRMTLLNYALRIASEAEIPISHILRGGPIGPCKREADLFHALEGVRASIDNVSCLRELDRRIRTDLQEISRFIDLTLVREHSDD